MRILVYLLCTLSVIKIFLDLPPEGDTFAVYSVFIESVIFIIIIAMIMRTFFKQREGRREKLQRTIQELNQMLSDIR